LGRNSKIREVQNGFDVKAKKIKYGKILKQSQNTKNNFLQKRTFFALLKIK